jgi:hypothetical protein
MDPNVALENLRSLLRTLQESIDAPELEESESDILENIQDDLESAQGLIEWLDGGGFLPTDWARKKNITEYMVKSCVFAQDHFVGSDMISSDLYFAMEPTSYQIACFLAQNTMLGHGGVEWSIVHEELCGDLKDEDQWKEIIGNLVTQFGGLK